MPSYDPFEPKPAPVNRGLSPLRYGAFAIGGVTALGLLYGSFYTVAPNENAYVTRFGAVISTSSEKSGLHFKLPVVDDVDSLPVSLSQLRIDPVTVNTLDNQAVAIGVNISYQVPPESVRHLLYEVGRAGNVDIAASLSPVVKDRALRVFASHNTTRISEERGAIAQDMQQAVAARVKEMFGIEVVDLQITHLEYSPAFQASVEQAVQAKNLAIQAENQVRQVEAQAQQTRIQSEASAYAKKQNADAEAYAIQKRSDALKQAPNLVELTLAEKWNGVLPTQMIPGQSVPFLNVK